MPTSRGFARKAFQGGFYEAQDVLCEIEDVDLIHLEPRPGFWFKQRWQRRLLYRDITKRLAFLNPGLKRVRLAREYDLFIAVCQNYWDLLNINAIDGWKDRCRTSVCWIDEVWVGELAKSGWLPALQQFDHVFVGFMGSVDAVSKAIGRPCKWLPYAVDTTRFTPFPRWPLRSIDVYSIGRRWRGIHEALLKEVAAGNLFYMYDTFPGADLEPSNHREHRGLLADIAKRSRYFLVAPAKMDEPTENAGQGEVGYRYFEGAASGTVMIGQAPSGPSFKELFGWPDGVIEIKPDGSDVVEVMAGLNSQPARVSEIWQRNASQALLRHDWVHRWDQMFNTIGLSPSRGTRARLSKLAELATLPISAGLEGSRT